MFAASTRFVCLASAVSLLCCLLLRVAPFFSFKLLFFICPVWLSAAVLQCWDLTRSLGGVSYSSHLAALLWLPLWSGLSSALTSRRRLNVSHHFIWLPDGCFFFFKTHGLKCLLSGCFFTWAFGQVRDLVLDMYCSNCLFILQVHPSIKWNSAIHFKIVSENQSLGLVL